MSIVIVATACVLGVAALAISAGAGRTATSLVAVLLVLAPLIGLIFKLTH